MLCKINKAVRTITQEHYKFFDPGTEMCQDCHDYLVLHNDVGLTVDKGEYYEGGVSHMQTTEKVQPLQFSSESYKYLDGTDFSYML